MKKILIATSALVAISAPAFALDVKTSGAVEYRYNKATEKNVAQNAKLSQQDAYIKFAASGASNGLAYGAWIKTKSGTATTYTGKKGSGYTAYMGAETTSKGYELKDFYKRVNVAGDNAAKQTALSKKVNIVAPKSETPAAGDTYGVWTEIGKTQSGQSVWAHSIVEAKNVAQTKGDKLITAGAVDSSATAKIDALNAGGTNSKIGSAYAIGDKPSTHADTKSNDEFTASSVTAFTGDESGENIYGVKKLVKAGANQTLANNASTQSAMWVNGAFGGLVIGQDGDATGLAPSGSVSAASFNGGKQLAYFTAGNKGERVTYTAPTFVDGLKVSYTHNFKGNVSADKSAKVKAPTSYGVQYATDFAGVMFKVGYAQADLGKQGSAKAIKNTKTGVELGYGGFTVGYGTFTVGKKAFQKSDTTGTNYGVKYASGAWAVGYTVNKSEDKNKYITHSNKTANTNAISASYKVADGFNVYASKSSNSVKNTNGKTEKNSYTIIGAKISF